MARITERKIFRLAESAGVLSGTLLAYLWSCGYFEGRRSKYPQVAQNGGLTVTKSRAATSISIGQKIKLLQDQWSPRVIAEMNDYQFKVVKLEGDFVWHDHPETDETFLVIDGELRIDFRDGSVTIGPGELYIVPKGVEHKPYAAKEVKLMLIEPRGVLNTGHAGGERTAQNDLWI